MNNSILTNEDYQTQIKAGIDETVTYNQNTDPNTLWEILKGPIRNMTVKYVTKLKKEANKNETNIKKKLEELEDCIFVLIHKFTF